jgi:K+-transporting ATPase c subunit
MLTLFALSDAVKATIAMIVIWGVAFPALVTVLIAVAAIGAFGERAQNAQARRYRK